MYKRVRFFSTEESFIRESALIIKTIARDSLRKRRNFNLALSGGSTPRDLYSWLGTNNFIPRRYWRKTNLWWADERFVPYSSPLSNYGNFLTSFLRKQLFRENNLHPVPTDFTSPAEAAIVYEKLILDAIKIEDGLPVFDLILLGIGSDGHTASLFPEKTIKSKSKIVLPVSKPNVEPKVPRVSLSLNLINNSRSILFLSLYQGKEEIIDRMIGHLLGNETAPNFPAGAVEAREKLIFHILKKG